MVEGWSRDGRGMVEGLSRASTESHFLCFYCPFFIFFADSLCFLGNGLPQRPSLKARDGRGIVEGLCGLSLSRSFVRFSSVFAGFPRFLHFSLNLLFLRVFSLLHDFSRFFVFFCSLLLFFLHFR